jgi:hypothetical protein
MTATEIQSVLEILPELGPACGASAGVGSVPLGLPGQEEQAPAGGSQPRGTEHFSEYQLIFY